MTDLADLVDALGAWEVHSDDLRRRSALAGQLLNAAITVDDVRVLGRYAQRIMADAASAHRFLVTLLNDPVKRQARLPVARTILRDPT